MIEKSLDKVCLCLNSRFNDKFDFESLEVSKENNAITELNPWYYVINKNWDKEVKKEVKESLLIIGKVLTGKANLESALIQNGFKLPNLETQKQVIIEYISK